MVIDGRILLHDVELEGRRCDVVTEFGRIDDVGAQLSTDGVDQVLDAGGGALLPGLHDHHVHLLAMAARRDGVDLLTASTPAEFDRLVRDSVATGGWVRAAGHDEHRHGALDRDRLDAIALGAKVRIQHRSGLAWTLSTAGLDDLSIGDDADERPRGVELDGAGRPTGRLLRMDGWMAERLGVRAPSMIGLGRELMEMGITGVTDATPALGAGRAKVLRDAVLDGHLPLRLTLLGIDDPSECEGWARVGPAKLVIDELDDPEVEDLAERIATWHRRGRPVAVHAVSRLETVATVAAFGRAGSVDGDRIEHGSVLPTDLDMVVAELGLTVIVQPSLVFERGDHYLAAVDPGDLPHLHRARSLLDAGIGVAAGSDAPVTSPDPWAAIASATTRCTADGAALGLDERVAAEVALGWFLTDPLAPGGPIRRVQSGAPADLCLLSRPLADVLASPSADDVRATMIDGRLHER